MSAAYQLVDVLVALVLALVVSLLLRALAPEIALSMGLVAATAYYFSRNPWGSREGAAYNDRVDAAYERVLPF